MVVYFAFLFHIYQPPIQIPPVVKQIVNESYRPIVDALRNNPDAKITLNINGTLTEQLNDFGYNDLIEGISMNRYLVGAEITPKIFQAAEKGDSVACEIIGWAAQQLANLVKGVVYQLGFQHKTFDVVEMGGVFKGGRLLTEPFHAAVLEQAPGAHFVSLKVPPVIGAVLLAAEGADVDQRRLREQLTKQSFDL